MEQCLVQSVNKHYSYSLKHLAGIAEVAIYFQIFPLSNLNNSNISLIEFK